MRRLGRKDHHDDAESGLLWAEDGGERRKADPELELKRDGSEGRGGQTIAIFASDSDQLLRIQIEDWIR